MAHPELNTGTDQLKPTDPQIFLASIQAPLMQWIVIDNELYAVRENYTGRTGIGFDAATEFAEVLLGIEQRRHQGRLITPHEINRATEKGREIMLDYLGGGTDSPSGRIMDIYSSLTTAILTPNETESVQLHTQRITAMRAEYHSKFKPLEEQWTNIGNLVIDPFKEIIAMRFENFPELCLYLQQADSEQSGPFIRLMERALKEPIKDALKNVRFREERNPSRSVLFAFFKHLASNHYRHGQKDELWTGIELFLQGGANTIEDLIVNGNQQDMEQLLEPLINATLGKDLPPLLAQKFSAYLLALQSVSWHTFETMTEQAKQPQTNGRTAKPVTWEQHRKKRTAHTDAAQIDRPDQNGQSPEKTLTKTVLINGDVCQDEVQIGEALQKLVKAKGVNKFTPEDLSAFKSIIAKLAGMRPNAPGYILEKLKAVNQVNLSTGESVPPQKLRRPGKPAGRLILLVAKSHIVILTAFDRTDTSYNDQLKKFNYETVQLPS